MYDNLRHQSQHPIVIETSDNRGDIVQRMGEGDRIKAERERRGLSQAQLAEMVGISQPAVKKIESGQTERSRFLPDVLRALDLDKPREANGTSGAGPLHVNAPPRLVSEEKTMRVYASSEGGEGALIVSTDIVEMVPRPYTLEGIPEAYGIVIEGESMVPAFEPGDIAWVNPRLGARRGHDVILYAIDQVLGETRAMIKRIVAFSDEAWTVQQYNPPKTFKMPRDAWQKCHRVVGKLSKR